MKLKRFWAKGVHGYLDMSLSFNARLNFLIGPNGSGKSTALALMEAMLTPSIKDLTLTEFSEAGIIIDEVGEERSLVVEKHEENITISVSWVLEKLTLRRLDKQKRELLASDIRAAEDYFEKLSFEYSSSDVIRAISQLNPPVFLGIERQHKSRISEEEGLLGESDLYRLNARVHSNTKRLLHGNLSPGLLDSQLLIQEGYREARRRLDSAQDQLRRDFLLASFQYSDVDDSNNNAFFFGRITDEEMVRITQSRDEITRALINLGVPENQVNDKVGRFYEKIDRLAERLDNVQNGADPETIFLEFLMNRGHIDRIFDVIALVRKYKDSTDRTFDRVNKFREQMNWFFKDSRKKLSLDQVGRIRISKPLSGSMPLDALSSGERQLLIIFSHVFFNSFGDRSKVFVVDEPELSLHIRWQESLVERIQSVLPDAQLVFATHSPDIVGGRDECCIEVGV